MADDYLGQAAFRLELLPARVAYLIAPGSTEGFRRAVEEASTRWAGVAEPIVPIRKNGHIVPWLRQVLSVSRVNALVRIDADPAAAEALGRRADLPLTELSAIDHSSPSRYTCNPLAVAPHDLRATPTSALAGRSAPLWQLTACGGLTDAAFQDMSSAGLRMNRELPEDHIARSQLLGTTLLDLGASQFSENTATNGPSVAPAIVWIIGAGTSLRDCIHYWNLRALRPFAFERIPMVVLPSAGTEHWLGFSDAVATLLGRAADISPDVILQGGVSARRLADIAITLNLVPSTDAPRGATHFPPPPNRIPPFTYRTDIDPRQFFVFERAYGAVAETTGQLFRSDTQLNFSSPVTFRGGGNTLALLSSQAFDEYPRRDAVAELISDNARWFNDRIQFATFAMGTYRIDLRLPVLDEVLARTLERLGLRHALSDKGRIGVSLASQIDIEELLKPGVYEALRALTTPRSRELLRALQRSPRRSDERHELIEIAATWGGRRERRYRSASQLTASGVPDSVDALEQLSALGWAERGLEIRCRACGVTYFVPLTSVSDDPRCPGCRSEQKLTIQQGGVAIFYRLNSLVDRASDQGVLPHLLVKAALRRQDRSSYAIPGLDIEFPDGRHSEVDVVGIHNRQVFSGEVKTEPSDFDPRQLRRDIRLSTELQSDTHVLASPAVIPAEVIDLAHRLAQAKGMDLIVLSSAELRPNDT